MPRCFFRVRGGVVDVIRQVRGNAETIDVAQTEYAGATHRPWCRYLSCTRRVGMPLRREQHCCRNHPRCRSQAGTRVKYAQYNRLLTHRYACICLVRSRAHCATSCPIRRILGLRGCWVPRCHSNRRRSLVERGGHPHRVAVRCGETIPFSCCVRCADTHIHQRPLFVQKFPPGKVPVAPLHIVYRFVSACTTLSYVAPSSPSWFNGVVGF